MITLKQAISDSQSPDLKLTESKPMAQSTQGMQSGITFITGNRGFNKDSGRANTCSPTSVDRTQHNITRGYKVLTTGNSVESSKGRKGTVVESKLVRKFLDTEVLANIVISRDHRGSTERAGILVQGSEIRLQDKHSGSSRQNSVNQRHQKSKDQKSIDLRPEMNINKVQDWAAYQPC